MAEAALEAGPRDRKIANLWTPDSHYTVRTSMYNRDAKSQAVHPTASGSMLVDSIDSSQQDTLRSIIASKTQVPRLVLSRFGWRSSAVGFYTTINRDSISAKTEGSVYTAGWGVLGLF